MSAFTQQVTAALAAALATAPASPGPSPGSPATLSVPAAVRAAEPLEHHARHSTERAWDSDDVAGPELRRVRIRFGDRKRTLALYIPERVRERPEIVLAFHGSGGDAERLQGFLGGELERLAERHGFILGYPEAYEGAWNGCRATNPSAANRQDIDDVGFTRAVIDHIARRHGGDPDRVYAIGFSGGGHMVYRLALEDPRAIAAAAIFGANLPVSDELDCRPDRPPPPVLIVNGTSDPINPYAGGDVISMTGEHLGRVRSAEASARYLAGGRREPAGRSRIEEMLAADEGGLRVTRAEWTGHGGTPIALVTIHGGGHVVPGARTAFPQPLGATERRFDGLGEALRFFARTTGASQAAHAG